MADLILILFVAIFAFVGSKKGLVKTLFGIASTFISIVLSMVLYKPISDLIYASSLGDTIRAFVTEYTAEKIPGVAQQFLLDKAVETGTYAVSNAIGFLVTVIAVKIIIAIVSNVLNILTKLPVLKQANKILGTAAGILGGILISYIVIGIVASLNTGGNIAVMKESIENSLIAITLYENNMIADVLTGFLK